MALERIKVFETRQTHSTVQVNDFLAKPDIRVDKIYTCASGTNGYPYHFITIVYWQLESAPKEPSDAVTISV